MKREEKKTPTRSERFAVVMAMLQETFCPEKPISSRKVRFYEKILEPFCIEDIEDAAEKIAFTKRIHAFPLPADFLAYLGIDENKHDLEGLELWNEACRLAFNSSYPSENETLNRAIEIAFGSWRDFGETDPNNTFDRHHFIGVYKMMMAEEQDKKRLTEDKGKLLESKK